MRRTDREVRDPQRIREILEKTKVFHLGLYDEESGFPYVVPLHYGYEERDGQLVIYAHGALQGRKIDLIRRHPQVCVQLECEVELVPGGEVPCRYGSTYASVIGTGEAEVLEDPQEKMHALELLMRHQTGREFAFTEQMTAGTAVIRVVLSQWSAKSRPAAKP